MTHVEVDIHVPEGPFTRLHRPKSTKEAASPVRGCRHATCHDLRTQPPSTMQTVFLLLAALGTLLGAAGQDLDRLIFVATAATNASSQRPTVQLALPDAAVEALAGELTTQLFLPLLSPNCSAALNATSITQLVQTALYSFLAESFTILQQNGSAAAPTLARAGTEAMLNTQQPENIVQLVAAAQGQPTPQQGRSSSSLRAGSGSSTAEAPQLLQAASLGSTAQAPEPQAEPAPEGIVTVRKGSSSDGSGVAGQGGSPAGGSERPYGIFSLPGDVKPVPAPEQGGGRKLRL